MADGTNPRRRRRSRGHHAPAQPAVDAPAPAPPVRGRPAGAERGLRDLIGAGPSQLGVTGALRGRDVNRPTEDDLARAEERVVIVRRNWKPLD